MSKPDGMQLFREALRQRVDRIQRATYSEVKLEFGEHGEVTLVATWPATRAGPAGEHRIVFTRSRVLGHTASSPPLLQRQSKRTCRIVDDIIAEIQRARRVRT